MSTTANNIFSYINSDAFASRTLTALNLQSLFGSGAAAFPIKEYPRGLGASHQPATVAGQGIPFVLFAPYLHAGLRSIRPDTILDELPTPQFAIVLPIPTSAMKTQYDVVYAEPNMEATGAGMANTLTDPSAGNITGGVLGGMTVAAVLRKLSGLPLGPAVKAGFLALSAAAGGLAVAAQMASGMAAASALVGAGSDVISRHTGGSINPFTEVLFQNVQFRTHQFVYTFQPRNLEDSIRIDEIVNMFKFYMLPAHGSARAGPVVPSGSEYFFTFPYEFQITYSVQDTTFTLMPSVLESVSVSYGGETDSPKFFYSKTDGKQWPTQVKLSLQFKEVLLLTRDNLDSDMDARTRDLVNRFGAFPREAVMNRSRFRF